MNDTNNLEQQQLIIHNQQDLIWDRITRWT